MIEIIKPNAQVVEFLNKQRHENLNILNFLKFNDCARVYVFDGDIANGIIATDGAGEDFFLASVNEVFIQHFWEGLTPGIKGFSGVPKPIAQLFCRDKETLWNSPCKAYMLKGDFEPHDDARYAHDSLRPDDAFWVDQHYTYRYEGSLAELQKSIEKMPSACIRMDGKLVSWCLTHYNEGSMGPVYTLEEYRRHGLGLVVVSRLIQKLLALDFIPYLHIVETNAPSMALMANFKGFVHTHDCVHFGIDKK